MSERTLDRYPAFEMHHRHTADTNPVTPILADRPADARRYLTGVDFLFLGSVRPVRPRVRVGQLLLRPDKRENR